MATNEVIDTLSKEFNLARTGEPDFLNQLSVAINSLIEDDFASLVQLLYTKDIDEEKLREMLTLNPAEDAGLLIARLLMERESQKMQARRSFKPNDDIPDDEKW